MALPQPVSRTKRTVEPPPGKRPWVFSSWPKRTSAEQTLMSAARCNSCAAFQVSPCVATIMGLVILFLRIGASIAHQLARIGRGRLSNGGLARIHVDAARKIIAMAEKDGAAQGIVMFTTGERYGQGMRG